MRIAILFCNDFSVLGGAERFILDIAMALDAVIVSPTYNEEVIKTYDTNRVIKFFSLNKQLPSEPLRQIMGMHLYKNLKLDFDFYIAIDDMALHYLNPSIPHIYYMLTPRRAVYDMYYGFLSSQGLLKKIFYGIGLNLISMYDRYFVKKNIANIACISHNVRNRINKIYQRYAPVVYPPVHTESFKYRPSEGYWLSVGRIDKWKRIELQIEAFRKMPDKRLVIAGKIYSHYEEVVKNAPDNVSFITNVNEPALIDLYSKCEGFITTAIDEDFGITPLEAMASGKPVVATKEGGYLETVVDGHTGILVSPDVDEIVQAVNEISENPEQYREACEEQAKRFDYIVFKEKINQLVENVIE
ncbi:glycosyltransferase [Candidatus Pacearchaeota archaeon]|nr:glycosyltransferase [Candidatus Pacearchaeota archaeon]